MGTAERAVALALSLAGAGVLIATANYGGRLVYDHAAGIPTEVLMSEQQNRTEGHEHAPGEGHGDETSGPAATDHVDPPGTPPHSHEPKEPAEHSHPAGTPAHEH